MLEWQTQLKYAPERIRRDFRYNPDTGIVSRRIRENFQACGWADRGYLRIFLYGRVVSVHRIAWCVYHGSWPQQIIDHINGNRADNRIVNLRECSHFENCQNRQINKNNTSGRAGVCLHKRSGTWQVRFGTRPNRRFLGQFKNKDDAYACYLAKKAEMHPFHPAIRS